MLRLITGLLCLLNVAHAGPYIEAGVGVPISPNTGYIPDGYGLISAGYSHYIDERLSFSLGFYHRSVTGKDNCSSVCYGDNTIEAKVRLEW